MPATVSPPTLEYGSAKDTLLRTLRRHTGIAAIYTVLGAVAPVWYVHINGEADYWTEGLYCAIPFGSLLSGAASGIWAIVNIARAAQRRLQRYVLLNGVILGVTSLSALFTLGAPVLHR